MSKLSGAPSCGDKLVGIMEQGSKPRVPQLVNVPSLLSGNRREAQS